jgi:hypothetical protein
MKCKNEGNNCSETKEIRRYEKGDKMNKGIMSRRRMKKNRIMSKSGGNTAAMGDNVNGN